MASENGWEPARANGDTQCEWITVPGTDPRVRLQLLKGWPLQVMQAFAADYHAYVEPLRDADSAAWTPTNKKADSNHLNGTAMDLNWQGADGKTFRLNITEERAYPGDEARNLRAVLDFYENTIFCGGFWSIRDWMHFQMGGNTFNNPATADFIRRKIRADGFSTYKRAALPPPPTGTYGLPPGSNSGGYGGNGVRFPDWVYALGNAFGIKPSTYPGHQENDRIEAGYARNPQRLNRGIDWASPGDPQEIDKLTRFADYLATIPQFLEQVIWQNPHTMRSIEVAGGRHQPGYFAADLDGHRNHVHTRQSQPIPIPGAPPPPPPPPPPPVNNATDVLARATGVTLAKAQEILVGVVNGLRDSQCTNVNRIAMWLAQIGHESAGFNATEEYQSGDESTDRWKYKGRTWIQITWRSNYAGLSKWAFDKGIVPTPTYFVDNPKKLAEIQYAGLGPAWYWTVARPQINSLCDKRDLVAVTQAINGGQNGAPDRKNRYDRALALGDQLLVLTTGIAPPQQPGDDMALVPQAEWDAVRDAIMNQRKSRSPLRELDEGTVGDAPDQIWDMDGSIHILVVYLMVSLGHPGQRALCERIATADPFRYPDRQMDRPVAQAILAEVDGNTALKDGILAALGRITTTVVPQAAPAQPVMVPERLPAVRVPMEYEPASDMYVATAPAPAGNTPDDLLNTLDKLKVFDESYREKFDELTKEPKKK